MNYRAQSVEEQRRAAPTTIGVLEIGRLGWALARGKILIAGLTLLAAVIASLFVNLATPRYKSEARVLIETRDDVLPDSDAELPWSRRCRMPALRPLQSSWPACSPGRRRWC
jgi:hypothetical protein